MLNQLDLLNSPTYNHLSIQNESSHTTNSGTYIPNDVGVYPGNTFRYYNQSVVISSNGTNVFLIDLLTENIIDSSQCVGWALRQGYNPFVLADNRSEILCSDRIISIINDTNGIVYFAELVTGTFDQTYRKPSGEWLERTCNSQSAGGLSFYLNNVSVKTINYSNCVNVYSGDPLIVNSTEEFALVSAAGNYYPILHDLELDYEVGNVFEERCYPAQNGAIYRNHFASSTWNYGVIASETDDAGNCVIFIGNDQSWMSFIADSSSIVTDASAWRDDCYIVSSTTATYLNSTKIAGASLTSDCLDENRYLYKSGSTLIMVDYDSDNDGVIDFKDAFPNDHTQTTDSDGDGYGDSSIGNFPDSCVLGFGNSTLDVFGCPDSDGDGVSDNGDAFPRDNSQSTDFDNDGYGDNLTGFKGDSCPQLFGFSNRNNTYGCPDTDFDGWADSQDFLPYDSSQWQDTDGDGYGDQLNGFEGDSCLTEFGKSSTDRFGCPDMDLDLTSDKNDAFPNNPTQITDRDGDGYGDNQTIGATQVDNFPSDTTQWNDTDNDGYGDNQNGNLPDRFPDNPLRWQDSDLDGVADEDDAFPIEPSQDTDSDGDGYGDNISGNRGDMFPHDYNEWEDTDGDNIGNNEDAFPFDPSQTVDLDGDGFGDNPRGTGADKFPEDATQWSDIDGDGYGDNIEGNAPDAFISDPTQWSDVDGDGFGDNPSGRLADAFPNDITQWEDLDGDGLGDNLSGNNPDPYLFDLDNDGYNDSIDPFPKLATPGDLDNDGVIDEEDVFPTDYREWADADADGEGDNADTDDDNDGWTDIDELREGTDPLSNKSQPIDGFEVIIPGTQISLGAWDLIGIFGGVPLFAWIAFGFATRNGRCDKYEELLRQATSREELEQVALRWEYSLMLRMLGPHQGIRLERLRSELDDKFEFGASTEPENIGINQTSLVEREGKKLPPIETKSETQSTPSKDTPATSTSENGYEWLKTDDGTNWYRVSGSGDEWAKFES